MSKLQTWRRWCNRIESEILTPYKFDKLIAEGYFGIIKPVLDDGEPADFHNWCTVNYGLSLAMVVRKLTDKDPRTYSIRKLVGDICAHNQCIKKKGYINRYPAHFRDIALKNWETKVSKTKSVLPKGIPSKHIEEIDRRAFKVNNITNKFLAHTNRAKNKRYTVKFDDIYSIIRDLIRIGYFYSDLVGGGIPDDDSNVSITYEWQSIFKRQWQDS